MVTTIRKIADAIVNDVRSGLTGYHHNMSMSVEQLEQDIVDMRLSVIKEYMMNGILPIQDLMMSINCVPVDCDSLEKCSCGTSGKPIAHFQIPQILFDYGLKKAIFYIGSPDKRHSFIIYTRPLEIAETIQKYRKRGKKKPWVYIDITPNKYGMLDGYIFDAPLIKQLSIIAIFKDPRQLEEFQCNCEEENMVDNNLNFIDNIVKERLTKQKLLYYRSYIVPPQPNDQKYNNG